MLVINYRSVRMTGIAIGAAMCLASTVFAQTPCNTQPKPYGAQMLDISRNLIGAAQPGITYFYICPTTTGNGEIDRYTYRQPFRLDLNNMTPCEELQNKMVLEGYYYSRTRMTDPWQGTILNTRIGWHNGFGNIKDSTGNIVATAKFEGTIGTNTSRPPMKLGVGSCYECGHHTGLMVITFINTAAVPSKAGVIKAFYQFDAIYPGTQACDNADPCATAFVVDGGTLDGVNFRTCQ